jgi:hypothetical protein
LTGRDVTDGHPVAAITGLQTTLDGKEDSLGLGTAGQTLSTNTAVNGKEWITPYNGSDKVSKDGDTMTGELLMDTAAIRIDAAWEGGDTRWSLSQYGADAGDGTFNIQEQLSSDGSYVANRLTILPGANSLTLNNDKAYFGAGIEAKDKISLSNSSNSSYKVDIYANADSMGLHTDSGSYNFMLYANNDDEAILKSYFPDLMLDGKRVVHDDSPRVLLYDASGDPYIAFRDESVRWQWIVDSNHHMVMQKRTASGDYQYSPMVFENNSTGRQLRFMSNTLKWDGELQLTGIPNTSGVYPVLYLTTTGPDMIYQGAINNNNVTNKVNVVDATSLVKSLSPISFNDDLKGNKRYTFMPEEVEMVDTALVIRNDKDEAILPDNDGILAMAIATIKELEARIASLEAK